MLRLATTTSARDSGLLDVLLPRFEERAGCRVDLIAVGTGAALALAEAGDADAVLVHAPAAEEAFLAAGHAARRERLFYNDFVVLGPPEDPAAVRGLGPAAALACIAAGGHGFLSRGDESGTHLRERERWAAAGGRPDWSGYAESGRGMGASLVMADELLAHVLCDRATYLRFAGRIELVPLVSEAPELANPYSVLATDPARHPAVQADLAQELVEFLISPAAQLAIAELELRGERPLRPARPLRE